MARRFKFWFAAEGLVSSFDCSLTPIENHIGLIGVPPVQMEGWDTYVR